MPVYFLQAGEGGPIKIGFASDIRKRIGNLQTAAPTPLIPLGYIKGDKETERGLHARFHRSRRTGEWFEPSPALMAVVSTATPLLARPPRPPMEVPEPLDVPLEHRTSRDWLECARRALIAEIASFITERRIAATTFGRLSVNDGKFVDRLCSGKNITTDLMIRAHDFIQAERAKALT